MIRMHRFWLITIAAALAAVIGPPSHAQPPAESSWGRGEIPRVVGMTGDAFVIRVRQQDTVDFDGLLFFELEVKPVGRVTVIADGDLPLAKALQKVAGKRVRLTLEAFERHTLERNRP